MKHTNHIAIAGAGVSGLTAAAALAQAGHRVVVFDQFDQARPVGSGLVIQPVGMKVLHQIGAGDAALAQGNRIHRMLGHEAVGGHRVLDVHYDRPGGPRFGLGIHRAALFQVVLDAAISAGAEIVTGHKVSAQRNQRLCFEGRKDAGPFRMIIDASGAHSPLSPLRAKPLGYGALWATVDWPENTGLPPDELRQIYRKASRMLGVLPVGSLHGDTSRKAAIFWSLPASSHESWCKQGLDRWRDEAITLWPEYAPFAAQITEPGQMAMARYSHGTLRRPWGNGVVHIGDAAHRASPQLGQGANMALLDAWALAQALEHAQGDADRAMQLYARTRRWHVRIYQLMSWAFTPQYQSDSHLLPILRDRLLFPMSMIPPLPRILSRLVCGDLLPPDGFGLKF
ncbi:FAD-dependent oxidoreductase [Roseinatronobacter alkalisoli]|uniref:NAD(P)/FAD-dependent oxidoreductase n=1 Tax=Roseinatronobacter alkalisoli TaxID=3028235 RepID=A0ABT5TF21_9RHOB|nr:NAD(P)/FAD-dependent oxidoreductase [Roseinatronobacter sp. HJB301]MDD7972767.1 NAD(P)/FAD-dependent oxidoreductase [Roseinatronobacter sp. HJB301]